MTYKVKSKNREIKHRATIIRLGYYELENEAYLQYGSHYSDLDSKEQKAISKKVAKNYNF
mgnify:CR=1 FL=1